MIIEHSRYWLFVARYWLLVARSWLLVKAIASLCHKTGGQVYYF